jgi:predicted DCC family thiol-disulfide oxidoreductase YuxK
MSSSRVSSGAAVIFDGTCAFCEGSVKFIARRDPQGYFRFGASQVGKGAELLAAHGLADEASQSVILIEDGRAYVRSTASLRIARRLRWPWSMLGVLLLVPRPLRDLVYRIVSRIRHRIAGPSNACEIPPPELRGRLI